MRRLALALLLLLAFTLGGVNPPAAQDDTSNLALWLVQAQCPNGGPPWSCPGATLSRTSFSSPLWFAKEDAYGQRVTSVISDDGSFFETIFSYPSHGPLMPLNGDGGEYYVDYGSAIYIAGTQDASNPGIQKF